MWEEIFYSQEKSGKYQLNTVVNNDDVIAQKE